MTTVQVARRAAADIRSVPEIMSNYRIDRIGLLKADIEGGEFAVFDGSEDLQWLERVDQVVLEVHPDWGDASSLIDGPDRLHLLPTAVAGIF